jgi:MoaA/NifB/PqqE/SkfB family radical SAM enzyme
MKQANKDTKIDIITSGWNHHDDSINKHSGAWCPIPFNAISLNPNGSLTRCMMSNEPMTEQGEYDNWDNEKFKNLRTNMIMGEWDTEGCSHCYIKEEMGLGSQRQNWLGNQIRMFPPEAYDNPSITDNPIRHLFLNFGNICNFKCRMCSPNFSNALLPEFNHMQELNISRQYSKSFSFNQTTQFKNINPTLDFLDYYYDQLHDIRSIWITGGEPFMDDTLYDAADVLTAFANPKDISITITTNGSKLDLDKLSRLSHFKSIALDISIDAVGDRFEYMRSNGLFSWEQMSKVIKDVCEFRKDNTWLDLSINASYQLYNADNIYDFIKFAAPISDMNLRVLTGPRYYQLAHASDDLKNEMRQQITRALDDFSSILTDRHRARLAAIIKMLDRDRNEEYWQEFVQVTNSVDEYREMYIRDYIPELSKEIEQTVHSPLQLHTKFCTK